MVRDIHRRGLEVVLVARKRIFRRIRSKRTGGIAKRSRISQRKARGQSG